MSQSSGKIKFFNKEKMFGFITCDDGSKDAFLHISEWRGKKPPEEKQSVTFETKESPKGIQAINVYPI